MSAAIRRVHGACAGARHDSLTFASCAFTLRFTPGSTLPARGTAPHDPIHDLRRFPGAGRFPVMLVTRATRDFLLDSPIRKVIMELRGSSIAIVFATVIAVACTGGDTVMPGAQVADSAGVPILTWDIATSPAPVHRVVKQLDLQIGAVDGSPETSVLAHRGPGRRRRWLHHRIECVGSRAAYLRQARKLQPDARADGGRSGRVRERSVHRGNRGRHHLRVRREPCPDQHIHARWPSFSIDRVVHGTWAGRARCCGCGTARFSPAPDGSIPADPSPPPHDVRLELDSIVVLHSSTAMPNRSTHCSCFRIATGCGGWRIGRRHRRHDGNDHAVRDAGVLRTDGMRPVVAHSEKLDVRFLEPDGGVASGVDVLGAQNPRPPKRSGRGREARLREASGDQPIDPWHDASISTTCPIGCRPSPTCWSPTTATSGVALSNFDLSGGGDWLVFSADGPAAGTVRTPPDLECSQSAATTSSESGPTSGCALAAKVPARLARCGQRAIEWPSQRGRVTRRPAYDALPPSRLPHGEVNVEAGKARSTSARPQNIATTRPPSPKASPL